MTPGMTSRPNNRQSTLPCTLWLIPDAAVVKTSARWTRADACAGAIPSTLTNNVLEISPNAMPKAPSIN